MVDKNNPRRQQSEPTQQTHTFSGSAAPLIITEEPAVRRSQWLNPEAAGPQTTSKPNSVCILLHQPTIITQAVIDSLSEKVYYGANTVCWIPNKCLLFDPANTGADPIDIEYFCTPAVHPTTGETITS